ncbi:oligoketide cyclase/lipid transport protein [Rubidibacter lacunae KORDI 51-2]|uniref:Oligoketide cyclase/lipid transport protein n=1 Tax=Rubidibacter lacunae KORDI 51-2 TaxID=582515 RepID=U5DH11_9CHRO|nr:SRPBCC family protein [Rubidibacter lacunae]ERN40547.1 oligoketide cyclase/lipid transport protein [Rubidibacter lacunae KORDI 51-2]
MNEEDLLPTSLDGSELLEPEPTVEAADAVEITTEARERERCLTARIAIARPLEPIWQVLTNYEALPEFIPSLEASRRLAHPHGGVRVEQIGFQQLLRVNFRARVVLDLDEIYPEQIHFRMVEGDFRRFEGYWSLAPTTDPTAGEVTTLTYNLTVLPPRTMPVGLIAQRLRRDLTVNLLAIRQRVTGT